MEQLRHTLVVVLLLVAIIACGEDETNDFIGTWKMISSSSKSFTFTFDSNGRFIALEDGSIDSEGTYHVSGNLRRLVGTEGTTTLVFSIIGNVMKLEYKEYDTVAIFENV